MKTSELTGAALDWAVAEANGTPIYRDGKTLSRMDVDGGIYWQPSIDWSQGGPIIERELICLDCQFDKNEWYTWTPAPDQATGESQAYGPTPLIAAMRCYVASKLGDEIDVPKELT
jgi:hypothetical protein